MKQKSYKMTAILLHLYYQDLWEEFKEKILPLLSDSVHLYVTTTEDTEIIRDIKRHAKEVFIVENRGADFGGFVWAYKLIKNKNYDFFLKIHSKKSLHNGDLGIIWRKKLTEVFFSDKDSFEKILVTMKKDSNIFMAGAYSCFFDRQREPLQSHFHLQNKETLKKLDSFLNISNHGCFFAGSMFMVSKKYLELLFKNVNLDTLYYSFDGEYSVECSLQHAFERMIGYGVDFYNGKFLIID
jgi:lipopolysaccharide biosynthesis protein